jgi:hypothetical protein
MSVADEFRAAVEAGDIETGLGLFAQDAVLRSPVSFKAFEGIEAISTLLRIIFRTFEDFRYTDQLEAADGIHALIFNARVGTREVEGLDLIRPGDDGRIRELTVMVRPLSAAIALAETVGPQLAAAAEGASA